MGFGKDLFESTIGSTAGTVGSQLVYGIGELTGYNDKLRNDQLKQQAALMQMQYGSNLALMKESYKSQKELWDATNAEEQIRHLKNAGLNPALMYAKGGTGGTTGGGGASVGGGNASDETSRQSANINSMMNGMTLMKLKSEIAVNESVANKNNAEAQTTTESRPILIEKMLQEGKGQWLTNLQERYKMGEFTDDVSVFKNKNLGEATITKGSLFTEQAAAELAQTLANTGNQEAQALLTNEKAKGYWQELLNDTARADNDKIKATATKLAAEWQTGEFVNWKTWADLARGVFKDVFQSIK